MVEDECVVFRWLERDSIRRVVVEEREDVGVVGECVERSWVWLKVAEEGACRNAIMRGGAGSVCILPLFAGQAALQTLQQTRSPVFVSVRKATIPPSCCSPTLAARSPWQCVGDSWLDLSQWTAARPPPRITEHALCAVQLPT